MKKYTIYDILNLIFTGLMPIFIFLYGFLLMMNFILDLNIDFGAASTLDLLSPYLLFSAIINSHIYKFCKYHRKMLYSTLTGNLMFYFDEYFVSDLSYNLCIISLMLVGLFGFLVSSYKFLKQIKSYGRKYKAIQRTR